MFAIAGVEGIVFHTWHFAALVGGRLIGAAPAVDFDIARYLPNRPDDTYHSGYFLSSPGLWVGLAVAAVFLAAAVRLRRYQGPI